MISIKTDEIFFRKKPITAAAFSGDGSCLALAARTVITIWDPLKNELMFVFGKSHTVKLLPQNINNNPCSLTTQPVLNC